MNRKSLMIGAAAVLLGGGAAAACYVMNAEDPKKTVIEAFQGVYAAGQSDPMEELFGLSGLLQEADREDSLTVKLEGSSNADLNRFAGAGFRFSADLSRGNTEEPSGARASSEFALVYHDMDIAAVNACYGDRKLQVTLPQLFSDVLTLDLSSGLADRIRNSAVFGSLLTDAGIDTDAFAGYIEELLSQSGAVSEPAEPVTPAGLMKRYREGCRAQEAFRESLTVAKTDAQTFTVDGTEQSCRGYTVDISKSSVIDFLRTSSDFFLQDEELRQAFVLRLEASVRLTEILGGNAEMASGEIQKQQYDDLQTKTDELIQILDESLGDIQMTVYVTKDGKLAAFSGTTAFTFKTADGSEPETTDASFSAELSGGSYRTQNMNAKLSLTDSAGPLEISLLRQGSCDGSSLTSDLSLTAAEAGTEYNLSCTGTYRADDGDFHVGADFGRDGTQSWNVSVTGTVDGLEKGSRIHVCVDSAEFLAGEASLVLSGEVSREPLTGEVKPPEGTAFDVLAATEEDWSRLLTESVSGIIGIAEKLEIPLY